MEEITAWPIDLAITVEPEANAWKAGSVVNGKLKDDPREMIHLVTDQLRPKFDWRDGQLFWRDDSGNGSAKDSRHSLNRLVEQSHRPR